MRGHYPERAAPGGRRPGLDPRAGAARGAAGTASPDELLVLCGGRGPPRPRPGTRAGGPGRVPPGPRLAGVEVRASAGPRGVPQPAPADPRQSVLPRAGRLETTVPATKRAPRAARSHGPAQRAQQIDHQVRSAPPRARAAPGDSRFAEQAGRGTMSGGGTRTLDGGAGGAGSATRGTRGRGQRAGSGAGGEPGRRVRGPRRSLLSSPTAWGGSGGGASPRGWRSVCCRLCWSGWGPRPRGTRSTRV